MCKYNESLSEPSGATGGHAQGKPRFDLIPWGVMDLVAQGFTYGATKHGARNWELGMDHSAHLAAAMRHLSALMQGYSIDAQSNQHHFVLAICRMMMYGSAFLDGIGHDNVLRHYPDEAASTSLEHEDARPVDDRGEHSPT